MVTAVIITITILLCNCKSSTESVTNTISVNLPGQGAVLGGFQTTVWNQQTFMQFCGIPYAESPKDQLRFKPPIRPSPWESVLDARTSGRRCPVTTTLNTLSEEELQQDLEDCLNLCIYTKDLTKQYPVMFYVYGGGFYNGSNNDFPARYLLEHEIVLVVPNYRIGALGWLSLNNIDMPGNVPLSDLIMALQWVRDYIHLFGGDARKITGVGQSAGAAILGALLLSPMTPNGLLHRYIMQSGSIFAPWSINQQPLQQAAHICQSLNCPNCSANSELYECLRSASVPMLLNVTSDERFGMTVGDYNQLLPLQPIDLWKSDHFQNRTIQALMTGFTKHDGSFVLASYYDGWKKILGDLSNVTVGQFASGLMNLAKDSTGLNNNILIKLLSLKNLWNTTEHKKAIPAYFDIANIIVMKSPVITLAHRMMRKTSVYLYSFDYDGSHTRFGYEFGNDHYPFEGGIHHSNDNIYLFSTHTLNENDTVMAQKMVNLWASFVIGGVPRSINEVDIPPMKDENGPFFRINKDIMVTNNVLDELSSTLDDPNNEELVRKNIEF